MEKGTILVNKQLQNVLGHPGEYRLVSTKNGKSRTFVPATSVIELLRNHRTQQNLDRLEAGSAWNDNGFVFCNELGERISPHTVYDNYKKIVASIGLPEARLHDLRHSYAVAALQAGDDIGKPWASYGVVHARRLRARHGADGTSQRGAHGIVHSICFGPVRENTRGKV